MEKLLKGAMFANKPGVMAAREMTANDKYTVVKMNQYGSKRTLLLSWGYYTEIYLPEVVNASNGGIANWKNANCTGLFILKTLDQFVQR